MTDRYWFWGSPALLVCNEINNVYSSHVMVCLLDTCNFLYETSSCVKWLFIKWRIIPLSLEDLEWKIIPFTLYIWWAEIFLVPSCHKCRKSRWILCWATHNFLAFPLVPFTCWHGWFHLFKRTLSLLLLTSSCRLSTWTQRICCSFS